MNKKGQTLVLFLLFIPIIFICAALIVDVGLMINSKIKSKELLNFAIEEEYDIEQYFSLNKINLKNINYIEKNEEECVIIDYDIRSVFGSIIGYKQYQVKVEKCNKRG